MEADFTFGARPDFRQTLEGAINHTLFWQKAPHLKQFKHADCRTDFTIVIHNWCCCITCRRPSGADGGSWQDEGAVSMVGNHPADSSEWPRPLLINACEQICTGGKGWAGEGGRLINPRHCFIKKTFVLSGAPVCPTAWYQFLNGHYEKTATQFEIPLGETGEESVYINCVHKSSDHLAMQRRTAGIPVGRPDPRPPPWAS